MNIKISKFIFLFLNLALVFSCQHIEKKENAMPHQVNAWFDQTDYQTLRILNYARAIDPQPKQDVLIQDPKAIQRLIDLISSLPPNGEEMISFAGTVPVIYLQFNAGKKTTEIEFYHGRIKTPGTSFYMVDHENEAKAFALVQTLMKSNGK